jgi:outer membrane biosynthesis protein TonB
MGADRLVRARSKPGEPARVPAPNPKPAPTPKPKPAPSSEPPAALEKAHVLAGIKKVLRGVNRCGDRYPAKGKVKVEAKVTAAGDVASVNVKETPDAALGECVASIVKTATFTRTQAGGSFVFPFVF